MKRTILTLSLIALMTLASVAADAQIAVNAGVRKDSVITSFAGSARFKDLRGMWFDRKSNELYVVEENPLTVYKFDRFGNPISYHALGDLETDLRGVTFAGAGQNEIYLKHTEGMIKLPLDFSESTKVEFFFAPHTEEGAEPELIPVDFSWVFPGKDGKPLYGYDKEKKIMYQCDPDGKCKVFIRALNRHGADVLTGNIKNATRDQWGRFFLVDEQARQIWMFSPDGRFQGSVARPIDLVNDKLYQPELIAFDRLKQRYVYDAGVLKIKLFNDIGLPIGEIDANSMSGPLFINPTAFEIDDLNRLYVLDKGDMTIKIFEISY